MKIHKVLAGDSLWVIAEKYRNQRGILETIEAILNANRAKFPTRTATLRVGWELVIPE